MHLPLVPFPLLAGLSALAALLIILGAASLASILSQERRRALGGRVKTWWVIYLVIGGALALGWQAVTLVFALISFIALKEFLTLAPTRREDRIAVLFVYASVLISYWSIWTDNYHYFLVIVPIYIFVATAVILALTDRPDGFLATVGIMHWGVIICVYNLGHCAFLMRTPDAETPQAGPAGLVFFLLVATLISEFAQAACDRLLRGHRISKKLSDTKTWEGLIAGTLIAGAAFVVLAPYYSPIPFWPSVFVGAVLPLWGAAGSLTMTAVKRDLGVRSSSRIMPDSDGVLDHAASLTFTAPWFFHMHAIFALQKF